MNDKLNRVFPDQKDAKYLLLLFCMVLGLFVPNLLSGLWTLPPPDFADLAFQWHPWKHFFRESYLSGRFPLWTPNDLCGTPFLAFSHNGSLYPPGFLYLFSFPAATTLSILFHLALISCSSYWLFRELDRSHEAAFICGLSFSMSGNFFLYLNFVTTLHTHAWIPLIVLAGVKLSRRYSAKWFLALALVFAMGFLAGDNEMLIYLLGFFIWLLILMPGANKKALWALVFSALVLGIVLVFAQFLPLLELFQSSLRGQDAFSPVFNTSILFMIVAVIFGLASLFMALPLPPNPVLSTGEFYPFYMGFLLFLGFFLGMSGKNSRFSRKLSLFFVFLALYFLALNIPGLHRLLGHVPVIGKLLLVHTMVPACTLCFLIIAGRGLDEFIDGHFPRLQKYSGIFMPVYGVMVLGIAFFLKPAVIARVIFGSVLVLFPFWRKRFKPGFWLVLIAVFDLYGMALSYFPRGSYKTFDLEPAFVSLLSNTEQDGRYLIISPRVVKESRLPYSAGMLIGAGSIDSWMRAPNWRYLRLAALAFPELVTRQNQGISFYDQLQFRNSRQITKERLDYLDLLNLRWVVSRFAVPVLENSGRYKFSRAGDLFIYENLDPMPRALFFTRARAGLSGDQAFESVKNREFDFRSELMVSGKGAPGAAVPAEPARAGPVMVRRMGPDELFLYFENRAPGYVFLDEVYFPGWVAELDNDPVRIWQADYAFRAVYAGPGKHVLRFFYRPVSFRIGLWTSIASAASLLLFAFLAGAGNRKDKRLTG